QEWPGNIKKYGLDRDHGTICNADNSNPTPNCTVGSGAATTSDGTLLATAQSFWDGVTPSGTGVTNGGVGGVLEASDITQRHIYTYTGTTTGNLGAVDLTAAAQAFTKANSAITPAMLGFTGSAATAANHDALIDYMYGYDSYDENNNGI